MSASECVCVCVRVYVCVCTCVSGEAGEDSSAGPDSQLLITCCSGEMDAFRNPFNYGMTFACVCVIMPVLLLVRTTLVSAIRMHAVPFAWQRPKFTRTCCAFLLFDFSRQICVFSTSWVGCYLVLYGEVHVQRERSRGREVERERVCVCTSESVRVNACLHVWVNVSVSDLSE